MGLHPAERIREYRDKGFWTDDTIDALLRERVARHGDIPALVDPMNRAALMEGPVRTLTWPELDEQVARLAQVLLDEGVRPGDVDAGLRAVDVQVAAVRELGTGGRLSVLRGRG